MNIKQPGKSRSLQIYTGIALLLLIIAAALPGIIKAEPGEVKDTDPMYWMDSKGTEEDINTILLTLAPAKEAEPEVSDSLAPFHESEPEGFRVFQRAENPNPEYGLELTGIKGEKSVSVTYKKAVPGDYITVLAVNKKSKEKWCGRIGKAEAKGDGAVSFTLPDGQSVGENADYRLFAWTENEVKQEAYGPVACKDLDALFSEETKEEPKEAVDEDKAAEEEKKDTDSKAAVKNENKAKKAIPQAKSQAPKASAAVPVPAVKDVDPMYWMGQREGGDTNRAMVWFGSYPQTDSGEKKPVLWRTLRSDGEGSGGGAVTLLSEYGQNAVWFDASAPDNQHWYNRDSGIGSSDLRAWMNGVGTGAMDPDMASRKADMEYNKPGGGAGNAKGSFYANAFSEKEKELIIKTTLPGEKGAEGSGEAAYDKIFALSARTDGGNGVYFKDDDDRKCYVSNFGKKAENTVTGKGIRIKNDLCQWSLRSPVRSSKAQFYTSNQGGAGIGYGDVNSAVVGARPAFNMNPADIIFTPASDTGGAPGEVSDSLKACHGEPASFSDTYSGGFRVFKRAGHPNHEYSISLLTTLGSQTADVKYTNATAGDYITVLVVNKETGQKWSGRIGQVAEEGSGTSTFHLPKDLTIEEGSPYRAFAWTENEEAREAYTSAACGDLDASLPYHLTFDGNGGTGTMENVQGYLKDQLTLPDSGFVRLDYLFKEWNTKRDGKGISYNKGDVITLNKDTTLYAVWEKKNKSSAANVDPMYWMGQREGGDTTRAMVWFGSYFQTSGGDKKPVLWRTLRSDGEGSYGNVVTLLSEYGLNVVWFDRGAPPNQHWYNKDDTIGSSDMRAWMNGYGTGAMAPDVVSREKDARAYNQSGGGPNNGKGSFYANAFTENEKGLIINTAIPGEQGINIKGDDTSDKIFALSAAADAANNKYFRDSQDRIIYPTDYILSGANTITGEPVMTKDGACRWSLRSPVLTNEALHARVEGDSGSIGANWTTYGSTGVRPALNLSPASVTFTPASNTGGAPSGVSADLTACQGTAPTSFSTSYNGGFRVFKRVKHSNEKYAVTLHTTLGSQTADVKYTNATDGDYITALVVDMDTGQKWSGRIGQVASGGNGTCTFNLPNGQKVEQGSSYRAFAWTENEEAQTAYASVACGNLNTASPYILTFDGNGGEGAMDGLEGDLKERTLPENTFTREGYIFKGWNTERDGSGTTYYDGGKIVIDKPTTIYATWQKEWIAPVDKTDLMYWMGQREGGDTNRAMVWFGKYPYKADASPAPVLWRTLRSDGEGNYGGAVTLLTEYSPNTSWFDKDSDDNSTVYNQHWYNTDSNNAGAYKKSSELRVWMNGMLTGAMFPNKTSRRIDEPYNQAGGGAEDIRGSFYAKAFGKAEKDLIMLTGIPGEAGYNNVMGGSTADKLFPLTADEIFSETYFKDNTDRFCIITELGITEGKTVSKIKADIEKDTGRCKWWTRTPEPADSRGASVKDIATYGSSISHSSPYGGSGVRIALNLDPAMVVFTPASETGGAPETSSGTLSACSGTAPNTFSTNYTGGFRVFSRSTHSNSDYKVKLSGREGSTTATVKYTNATAGDYVSVLAADTETGRKWSSRIAQVDADGSGTADFTLPAGQAVRGADSGKYRLFAWTENEGSKTAYSKAAAETLDKLTYEPAFTTEPRSVTGKTDTEVSLTSEVDGLAPLSYDWYITSGTGAAGGTKVGTTSTGSFTYELTAKDNGKNYYCIATDSAGQTVTSDTAEINVYYPPTIKTQPKALAGIPGKDAEFTVEGEDGNPSTYTYLWQYRTSDSGTWENVPKSVGTGGTSATLTVPVTEAKDGYEFRCYVGSSQYDGTNGTLSSAAVLTLREGPPAPEIQYLGVTGPFDWSMDTNGQAFIPVQASDTEEEVIIEYQVGEGDWKEFTGSKVITITDDGISEAEPISGEKARIIVKMEGQHVINLRAVNKEESALISDTTAVTTKLDRTFPKGKLEDGKGTVWDQISSLSSFGKYYKENVVFTITDIKDDPAAGVSAASGIKKTQYYIYEAGTKADENELKSITADNIAAKSLSWDWQDYNAGGFTVSPDKKFVVYVRIEDNAGNLHFIGSDGLVADAANPTAEITQSPKGWTNGEVTLTVNASDALSGLDEKPYSFDGGASYVETNSDTYDSNGAKTIKVKDKAGNILTSTYTISSIDKVKPDITGFKKHTKKTGSTKKMVVTFKVKDAESGVGKVVYGTESDLSLTAAKEAIEGDIDGNTNAGDGYVWYHFETTMEEANRDYYVRTKDKAGNQSASIWAYEAENLIDVSVPVKMMFAVIPNLGGGKDHRLLSPDYEIKNNNNSTELEVGMNGFKAAAGGKIVLTGETAAKANELNLKVGKGGGAFAPMGDNNSLYPLSGKGAKEISFGTLNKAGASGAAGTFRFTGNLFDYERSGNLSQKTVLRSRYAAELHFSIILPKN